MARIRTVKIDFFRDEDLCVFGFAHRLLFEGLWLLADKSGRLEDRPRRIHADIFPFDTSLDVNAMLDDLAGAQRPFIQRYTAAGRKYIQIGKFLKHQRPHFTEKDSVIPSPDQGDHLFPPLCHGESTLDDGLSKYEIGRELKREGNGDRETLALVSPLPTPEALQQAWNEGTSAPLPQCRELSDKRRRHAAARLRERPLDEWRIVIGRINASPFCRGDSDRGWLASFDWLVQPDTAVKVLEGKYDATKRTPANMPRPMAQIVDWREECQRVHGGRCTNAHFHRDMMPDDKAAS